MKQGGRGSCRAYALRLGGAAPSLFHDKTKSKVSTPEYLYYLIP